MEVLSIANNMDLIKSAANLTKYFYEVLGEGALGLIAVLDDNELGFVGVKDCKCLYVRNNKDNLLINEFGINDEFDLEYFMNNDNVIVFDDDAVLLQTPNGVLEELRCVSLPEPDDDNFNGRIIYTQIDELRKVNLELHYRYDYPSEKRHLHIYDSQIKYPNYVYLTDYNKKGLHRFPGVGNKFNFYAAYEMPYDSRGAQIFKDNTGKDVIRYMRLVYLNKDEVYNDLWPLSGSKSQNEVYQMISDKGFKENVPSILIDVFNRDNKDYLKYIELAEIIKRVTLDNQEFNQAQLIMRREN